MRIAIEASTWANTRGYGRFTRELTRALLRTATPHRFTLVADFVPGPDVAPLPDAEIVTVSTGRSVVEAATADSARSPIDMLRVGSRLSRGFDAVVFPTNYSFVPVRPGLQVAVVIHDAIPEAMPELVLGSRKAQLLWNLKNRLACWQADVLATVSQASATAIRRHLPVGNREIVVLTEGAAEIFSAQPTPDDDRLRREAGATSSRYVLFVGGISPHKRVAELIRAFAEVTASGAHDDLQLVLAGPDGRDNFTADQSGVTEAIAALGARRERVVRTGFVPDAALAALYRGATTVVLPSMAEGFGLPALEAMVSGAPLIAARTPALEEVTGGAADLVDIGELPTALHRLLTDAHRRESLRQRGLVRARDFGWDEAARRMLAALDARARSNPART